MSRFGNIAKNQKTVNLIKIDMNQFLKIRFFKTNILQNHSKTFAQKLRKMQQKLSYFLQNISRNSQEIVC